MNKLYDDLQKVISASYFVTNDITIYEFISLFRLTIPKSNDMEKLFHKSKQIGGCHYATYH